jgi:hypothetical protein
MHLVETGRRFVDLGTTMTQMRTWFDHHRVEPSLFLHDREIRFRLQFQNASDASAFASVLDCDGLGERDIAAA